MNKWILGFVLMVSAAGLVYAVVTGVMRVAELSGQMSSLGYSTPFVAAVILVSTVISILILFLFVKLLKKFGLGGKNK